MLRRFASVMAVGGLALTSYSVMAAAPAAANPGKNAIEVTKVVVGENKGVGYEVVVDCHRIEDNNTDLSALFMGQNPFPQTLTFGPEGGTQTVDGIRDGRTCTIVETHNGGATSTVVDPSECVFPEENKDLNATVENGEGTTCHVTVTNTFEPPPGPIPGPAGPAGAAGAAGACSCPTPGGAAVAVVSTARFTG